MIQDNMIRPVARIDFWGGAGPPKVDFFEPHPLTLLQKPHFWPTLWLKVDLLADLGGATPLATGLDMINVIERRVC